MVDVSCPGSPTWAGWQGQSVQVGQWGWTRGGEAQCCVGRWESSRRLVSGRMKGGLREEATGAGAREIHIFIYRQYVT